MWGDTMEGVALTVLLRDVENDVESDSGNEEVSSEPVRDIAQSFAMAPSALASSEANVSHDPMSEVSAQAILPLFLSQASGNEFDKGIR